MKIQISPELETILRERLVYKNEFIEEAIRFALESDEFKRQWLRKELQKGLDQADRGELLEVSMEEIIAEVEAEEQNSRPKWQRSNLPLKPAQT